MNWRTHIETNNQILVGKPIIKGTRLSVEHIINLLASGWTEQQILKNYPRLTKEIFKKDINLRLWNLFKMGQFSTQRTRRVFD